MALIADHWAKRDRLRGGGVVATVMSNLGLERFLAARNLKLERTQVGDRYVMARMREGGFNFGGEQSGHMILSDFSTTGDGLLAALQLLRIMRERDKPISALAGLLHLYPQTLINVAVKEKKPFEELPAVVAAQKEAEALLNDRGRVLLRYSGTESLARVMVEGEDEEEVERLARQIAEAVKRELR